MPTNRPSTATPKNTLYPTTIHFPAERILLLLKPTTLWNSLDLVDEENAIGKSDKNDGKNIHAGSKLTTNPMKRRKTNASLGSPLLGELQTSPKPMKTRKTSATPKPMRTRKPATTPKPMKARKKKTPQPKKPKATPKPRVRRSRAKRKETSEPPPAEANGSIPQMVDYPKEELHTYAENNENVENYQNRIKQLEDPSRIVFTQANEMTRQGWIPPPTPINQDPNTPFRPPLMPKDEDGSPGSPSLNRTHDVELKELGRPKLTVTTPRLGAITNSPVRPKKLFYDIPVVPEELHAQLFSQLPVFANTDSEGTVSEVDDAKYLIALFPTRKPTALDNTRFPGGLDY